MCRCGCINDVSDGRKVCSSCGLELVIKCPKCGAENDASINVCKCGFRFENLDKAMALCEQAEYAMRTLDFPVARPTSPTLTGIGRATAAFRPCKASWQNMRSGWAARWPSCAAP